MLRHLLAICLVLISCLASEQTHFDTKLPDEFDLHGYQLIHFEGLDGRQYGSLHSQLNFIVAHYSSDIFRKAAIISFYDVLYASSVQAMLSQILSQKPLGLLFLVPEKLTKSEIFGTYPDVSNWEELQMILSKQSLEIPVYFVKEEEQTVAFYNEQREVAFLKATGQIRSQNWWSQLFSIEIPEFVAFTNPGEATVQEENTVEVFYSLLSFSSVPDSNRPIIAISASYDALSIAPELSIGMGASGASLLAVLSLAKIFNEVKHSKRFNASDFEYDILFILSPTASLKYEATQQFLEILKTNIRESIRLVVCLDSLIDQYNNIDEQLLYVHGLVTELSEKFTQQLKLTVGNKNEEQRGVQTFEHTVYKDKGIPAITVSSLYRPYLQSIYQKYSIFDSQLPCSQQLFKLYTSIADALFFTISSSTQAKLPIDFLATALPLSFLSNVTALLQYTPRSPAHHLQKDSPTTNTLYALFTQSAHHVQRMSISLKQSPYFYPSPSVTIHASRVGARGLELLVFIGTILYLMLLTGIAQHLSREKTIKKD
ncbi:hypothetical protein FGO68_gene14046 [Halteria grandinella]|uniref:Nicalin n=1 Tax=Halteria grandinella TaxID=5974 RepID=A0A8J8NXL9_HALGN|nr:hypothetical protein FGO68_gene14046 [Halteria grandinella]